MSHHMEKKERIWTGTFVLVFLINLFNGIAMYMTNPVMPDYLTEMQVPFALTGIISSILSWVSMTLRPFSGWASDRYNQKKMMILFYGLNSLSLFLYPLCPNVFWIIMVRILHGISFGFTATLSLTFATTFLKKSALAESLAYLSLGQLIGSMFGPQIGSMIADAFSMKWVFFLAALLNGIAFLIIFFLPYQFEAMETKEAFRIRADQLIYKDALPYMILIGIFSIGNGIISYYLRNFGTVRKIDNVALFFTVNSLAMALLKPIASKIHDRRGIACIIYPAFLLSAISMVLLSGATTLYVVLIAAVLKAMGQGTGSPALQAESARVAERGKSGVAISTCLVGQDLGNIIGPMAGSLVIETCGYRLTFLALAILCLAGLGYFHLFHRNHKAAKDIPLAE
ncbi:MAG: MFS transporter [Erysipelotrichaceae bacterium]|nr:MFS transporter [Erysipelotrichaceae bacterium]